MTVQFGATTYEVVEGETVTVAVTLSEDPERTVVIPITHTPRSGADSPADYSVPQSVTFDAGEMSKTIAFTATQDDVDDDGESVLLGFGAPLPGGVSLGTTVTTTVSITDDDDPQVAVSFDRASYRVLEGDTVTVGVTLSGDPKRTVEIPLTATDYGGVTSVDYSGVPTSVTINAGETSKTFEFMAMADDASDTGESVMIGFGTSLPSRVKEGTPNEARVTINQMSTQLGSGVTVSFGASSYTVAEGDIVTVTVTLSADPERTVVIPITHTPQGSTTSADYSGVPANVTFSTGDMSQTITFTATQDDVDHGGKSVLLAFGTPLPGGVSLGTTTTTTVNITDDDEPQGQEPGNVGRRGTVVTIERVPDGTVIPDQSSLWVGATVEDGSTFIEGTQALFRLKFEAVGGGPPVGTGVDVDLRFSWQIPSPLVTNHGQVGSASFSLHRVDVWDTEVRIHDNDVGHPDGTLTIRIIGCERSDCMIGTPSQITLTIADDDGGPEAAIPGPPDLPSLVCARSGDGYDDTGIAVSWKAPNFVGGAPVESYELRYRQSSRFVGGTLIEHPWESWPHGVAATSATLTGLVTRANYTVEVRAVSAIGPGQWSEPNYFRVGPTDEVCEIIDQLTPQPLNPPQPDSARQPLSNAPAEGEPQINGIPEVGQTLSADTTAIADADGLENAVFQYQWLAEDADISGANGATYTVVSGDVGQAIRVRVTFTDDAGHEETLTSAPTVVTAGLQLQSATVDGAILTLTYSEVLDTGVTLGTTPFAVSVNGSSRSLIGVGVGESNVLLFLSSAVEAGDTVTVDYTPPDGPDFIRDSRGRKAASFSGQAVTNDTASPPLTASAHDAPASHNGQDAFTFELRFSEDPEPDFSYTSVRDHVFTVTGGTVTYVRRLEPGKNVRWEITVTPGSSDAVAISLNATTDCSAQGAICTEDGGKLSGGLLLVVPGPNARATPNTPATGVPTITGTARVGETLTADTTGISDDDGLNNATFAYQWLADDAEIDSATASSYTLVASDAGKAIKVRVSFNDDAGNDEELTSAATGAVAAAPPTPNTPATGLPTITGAVQVGGTLTAGATGISDADGLDNASFAYQWLADDAEIDSATASTYTLVAADAGKAVKVRVSFTDDAGNDEELTSAATGAVAAAPPTPNTPATGSPTITGAVQVGETLTAGATGISDDDGLDNAIFSYQWLADDAEINGATAATYTLVAADAGKAVKVRVSFTDDADNDEQITSAATGAVAAAPPPPNTPATGVPTITGAVQVGETLTAGATGISDDDGLDNATFAYQWLADDAEINGATASTYTLVAADAGKAVKVRVSFTDDAGNDEQIISAATGAVAAAPPPPNTPATGLPTITGAVQVGETLTAGATGISDDDGLDNATFAYQWLAAAAEINGATASTYTLVAADAGKAVKVRVSFTDDAGNDEELTSAATSAVAAAPPPPNTPATGLPTITGAVQVGETLTAVATGISDDDGLDNATFAYQWLADDAEINGATDFTYTLVASDAGKAIKVRVSFTDDAGNDEELTSAATGAVAAAVVKPPLTGSAHDVPASHNGQDAFTFELRFSEDPEPDFSYVTVRDHAFTVTGGSVTYVRRLEPGKNVRWEITVTPGSSADVAITLNATTDCSAEGAICTEDGRMLSNLLELTIIGPGQ